MPSILIKMHSTAVGRCVPSIWHELVIIAYAPWLATSQLAQAKCGNVELSCKNAMLHH